MPRRYVIKRRGKPMKSKYGKKSHTEHEMYTGRGHSLSEGSVHKGAHQVEDVHKHNPYKCDSKPLMTNIKVAKPKL